MPVNIYDTPADAQFINTYERMPVDQITQAGIAMQDRWDRGEAAEDALEAALDIDVNQWRIPEKREAVGKYKEKINALIEEAGGEYHKALPGLERMYKDLQGDLKEGVLGGLQSDYQAREVYKAELEERKKAKKNPLDPIKAEEMLAMADYTAKASGKLQKGEYGTWTKGQYQGTTPATQINYFKESRKLLKEIDKITNEQLGPWLEGKGIPYVVNPTTGDIEVSRVGLPEGSYEAIDATIKGRGTPEQLAAFLHTIFANDPQFQNIIEEEAMLQMHHLDRAEELQPGIKDKQLQNSVTDLDTVQRLEEEGIDIYSQEGQDALLNNTLERDIKSNLIEAPIWQAVLAHGGQEVSYTRNKITPSTSSGGSGGKLNLDNIMVNKAVDLLTNSRPGLKLQEENLVTQREEITDLQGRIVEAKKIAAQNNNNPSFLEEVSNLEEDLRNAEQQLTTSERQLKSAYEEAQVIDPETGEMITDSYIERKGQEKYDEFWYAAHPDQSDPAQAYYGEPGAAIQAEAEKQRVMSNLRGMKDDALDRAEEEGLFSVTKFPFVFSSSSSGEYKNQIGDKNELNTAHFYQQGGAGWSMVLNGSADEGLPAREFINKHIAESDKWTEGTNWVPTGEVFIQATNQVDRNGYPVYSIGIEGKQGDTKEIRSSFLITKGEAGQTDFLDLATALATSDKPRYAKIGKQMLADQYLAKNLRQLDLHSMKNNEIITIPGLKYPETGAPIKLIKEKGSDTRNAEFIAVIDAPEGDETGIKGPMHNGKRAYYTPIIRRAGGEEDLYRKLYDFHTNATRDAGQTSTTATTAVDPSLLAAPTAPASPTITASSTVLPSEDLAGYKKVAKEEAKELGAVEIKDSDFTHVTVSDSAFAPYAQPVVKDFLELVDQEELAVEVDGLFRTDAYNKALPDSAANSLHKEALGIDLDIKKDSEKHKDIIKLIESWNEYSHMTDYKIEAVHHGSPPHLHLEFVDAT